MIVEEEEEQNTNSSDIEITEVNETKDSQRMEEGKRQEEDGGETERERKK